MAKDYGRRRPTRQKSSLPKQLFWLLASFLGGYLAATVFDFTSLSSWINAHILTKHPSLKQAEVAIKEPVLPKPKFEFYTLLTKDGSKPVAVMQPSKPTSSQPAAAASAAATKTSSPSPSAPAAQTPAINKVVVSEAKPLPITAALSKETYLIQIAAFKNRQDAEHMKATLILKGFDVSVVATSPQQGAWFRVIVGPFNSRVAAEKAQVNLAQNERIKGMIRKMDA